MPPALKWPEADPLVEAGRQWPVVVSPAGGSCGASDDILHWCQPREGMLPSVDAGQVCGPGCALVALNTCPGAVTQLQVCLRVEVWAR